MDTLRSRHLLITNGHALTGLMTAVWGAGLPALDARLDLGPAALGAMLLVVAGSALLSMRAAGRFAGPSGRMLAVALPCAAASLIVAGLSPSLPVLLLAAAAFGVGCGATNIALSTEAMAVECAMGRPVIARMHGFWTLGAAGGGVLLAAVLHAGVDSRLAISGAAGLVVAASALLGARMRAVPESPREASRATVDSHVAKASDAGGPALGRAHLIALGVLGAAAFLTEGAATDWSGVHATRILGADPAIGSLIYGVFFATMTVMRFSGDALRLRLGPLRTVRVTSSLAVIGYAAVLISGLLPSRPLAVATALLGWALAGAGTALIWPIVIGTLAERGETARRLSVVTMIGYSGGLVGPALIGLLAAGLSLSLALLLPAALALLVAITAPGVISRGRGIRPSSSSTTPPSVAVPETP
ncbi:hypothetical protein [Microbacterium sp. K24]|uniref:hypothetical protein n=1 Tax=Microbacterium sp. K24 TaxID=2305446 RepID=UPI00197B11D3|nr:hypothetical protein [Microbacterium sp. K24]